MMKLKLSRIIIATTFSILGFNLCNAATISLDLDSQTPGIQSSMTLVAGTTYDFDVVFTGDGTTQFDTFALNLTNNYFNGTPFINTHSPSAGSIADTAPLMAMDIYNATPVSNGDRLTQGNMPTPIGYDESLGGVGISSLGDMPFTLLEVNESITLFSGRLTTLQTGNGILALTGFPFGSNAELSLRGTSIPVTLETANASVVPLPPAVWLFTTGFLTMLGFRNRGSQLKKKRKVLSRKWALLPVALFSPLAFSSPSSNADVNGDLLVNSLDISKISSCFRQNPVSNTACVVADVDEDGDIDLDDYKFVSARLGQTYNKNNDPLAYDFGSINVSIGDINKDGVPDTVSQNGEQIQVWLGNGSGGFQQPQPIASEYGAKLHSLYDVNTDGLLDLVGVIPMRGSVTIQIGNGDGTFQSPQNSYQTEMSLVVMAIGDIDTDGKNDIVLKYGGSTDIFMLPGNGDGSFQMPQYLFNHGYQDKLKLADLNGDGLMDIMAIYHNVTVILANGDGTFRIEQTIGVTSETPTDLALGDLNNDGMLDAAVAFGNGVRILSNQGDGHFLLIDHDYGYLETSLPDMVSLGDVDSDGSLDLLVTGFYDNFVSLALNKGDGRFHNPQELASGDCMFKALDDFNRDGKQDVLILDLGLYQYFVLLGKGDGRFQTHACTIE